MSSFSQYSVAPKIDLEIKPISLTKNSVLTSNSVLSSKSELQSKPFVYNVPKLNSEFVNSTLNSLSSFLDKTNAEKLDNNNLLAYQQIQAQDETIQEPKSKNKTILITGISVISVVVLSIVIVSFLKHKK